MISISSSERPFVSGINNENAPIAPMLMVANMKKILYPRLVIIWGVNLDTKKSALKLVHKST